MLSRLITATGVTDLAGAASVAIGLWIAFPVMILVGSVMWDHVPWKLGVIHAGDWFLKLVLVTALLDLWR